MQNQKTLPHRLSALATLPLIALSGCVSTEGLYKPRMDLAVAQATTVPALRDAATKAAAEADKKRAEEITAIEVDTVDESKLVSVNGANAAFYTLMGPLAKRMGYSLALVDGVDASRKINVDINNQSLETALRSLARIAGYVAVFDHNEKAITVAERASVVFKLPPNAFRKIGNKFQVGGSASGGSSGGGSGGSGGGASAQSSPLKADFSIDGSRANNSKGLESILSSLAGRNAGVTIDADTGMVYMTGNGVAIKRVWDFLTEHAKNAITKIAIDAAIVEVRIGDEFRYGIKWDKILDAAGTKKFGFNSTITSSGASNATISGGYTTATISSLIEALDKNGGAESTIQPTLTLNNDGSAQIFSGNNIPYIPSITTNNSGTASNVVSVTATGAYAVSGVTLSVAGTVVDKNTIDLTLMPVTRLVQSMKSFLNGQLTMPEESVIQSFNPVNVEPGKTLIISGSRYVSRTLERAGVPVVMRTPIVGDVLSGTAKTEDIRESVILIRANILAPKTAPNILHSESI